jgi:DNA mismatch repair protein MutL
MACHGAIRANQSLSHEQMAELMAQLDQCKNPFHCPHGRPTWFNLTSKSLEKSFRRTG